MPSDIAAAPRIVVNPPDALLDQPIAPRLTGFAAGATVILRARAGSVDTGEWTAWATFITNGDGEVDVTATAPIAGSYAGVDPNGLLWSLSPVAGDGPRSPFVDGVNPIDIDVTAETGGEIVASARIVRRAVAPGVTVREIREPGVVANLFRPPGSGPFPAILVVGGSGGGFADGAAALYASYGYAALSLAYFNAPGLPGELLNIPLEYFDGAIEWFRRQPGTDPDRLAISGTSRGGELALLLASRHPTLSAVVAWVPSGYSWGAVSRRADDEGPDGAPSWTAGGSPVPYVGRIRNDAVPAEPGGTLTLTPAFLQALEDTERAEAAAIPVERINGPILLISGKDDALWPSAHFSDLIVRRLMTRGFGHPYQHLSYEGAGHTLGPRYAPTTVLSGFHPVRKVWIAYGGNPAAIAAARADAWPRVLEFLHTHLQRQPVDTGSRAAD